MWAKFRAFDVARVRWTGRGRIARRQRGLTGHVLEFYRSGNRRRENDTVVSRREQVL
ncbi:hypothetical protein [Sorangium sp. So ce1097]|uniref:hypothetical protein n=1 Tax=Sorangium sp. So ce1097 TaxID=3133330 RepID=UPI003F5DA292